MSAWGDFARVKTWVGYWIAVCPDEPFTMDDLLSLSDVFEEGDLQAALAALVRERRVLPSVLRRHPTTYVMARRPGKRDYVACSGTESR